MLNTGAPSSSPKTHLHEIRRRREWRRLRRARSEQRQAQGGWTGQRATGSSSPPKSDDDAAAVAVERPTVTDGVGDGLSMGSSDGNPDSTDGNMRGGRRAANSMRIGRNSTGERRWQAAGGGPTYGGDETHHDPAPHARSIAIRRQAWQQRGCDGQPRELRGFISNVPRVEGRN
ncbi:hypothetical protein ACLOJK_013879 [Asimina triloba]